MYVLNTQIHDYFGRVKRGELALPHYQRLWAWSRPMVCEFFRGILLGRPVGAILTYEVPNDDPLEARAINNAPQLTQVSRYLLDGQQRLTSLYMGLTNTFDRDNCRYYVDLSGAALTVRVVAQPTHWLDDPAQCVERMCFPLPLFSPDAEGIRTQFFMDLAQQAGAQFPEAERIQLQARISQLAQQLRNHQIPELVLERDVPPDVALDVFVKMNTNNSDLDPEDIAVAMVALRNGNLRDFFGQVEDHVPGLPKITHLPGAVLATAALLTGSKPSAPVFRSESIADFLANPDNQQKITDGLEKAVSILRTLRVHSGRMLPTKTVIPLLTAIWVRASQDQQLGAQQMANVDDFLRRLFWYAALSIRYDRQSNARVLVDCTRIVETIDQIIARNWDQVAAPVFQAPLPSPQEIKEAGFPTGSSRLGKAVFLVTLQNGAPDPLTGVPFDVDVAQSGLPDYHHFFPKGWAETHNIDSQVYNTAMNCVFLQPLANREVQQRAPHDYILNCQGNPRGWACRQGAEGDSSEIDEGRLQEMKERLAHHLIPVDEALAEITGNNVEEVAQQAAEVFDAFLTRRAERVRGEIDRLVAGNEG